MTEHIPQPVIVAEIIKQVVAKVAAASGIDVKFYHDSPEQLEAKLISKQENGQIKYPAILLYHDFPEDNGGEFYGNITIPRIIIVTTTKRELFADARYAKTFIPTLYPLYEWFKKKMAQHPQVVLNDPADLIHRKWDRLDIGTKEAGQELEDILDAIEIQNMKITLNQNC